MTTEPAKKARLMPKGGRKGGSIFPRVALKDALCYAHKLVSKTHTSAQPKDVILSGVVGAKAGLGAVRISSLKQYGFLKGDTKTNFLADDLGKKIAAAPADELVPLYRQAMLKPIIFKKLFDTFQGDTVSKAKLKQRVADLKVHPDEAATCVDLYLSGMTTAKFVTVEGEQVKHMASNYVIVPSAQNDLCETELESRDEESVGEESNDAKDGGGEETGVPPKDNSNGENVPKGKVTKGVTQSGPRAVFNVNVTLDSSLDIEKLQKQLELLKRFGAI